MRFIIEQSDESITTHSGLSLIGLLLEKTRLGPRLNATILSDMGTPEISNRKVAYSYLGLLCQGKSDFDHIEPFREDEFFFAALQMGTVPSSPTLRQRLDMAATGSGWQTILLEESGNLLRSLGVAVSPVHLGADSKRAYVPLDVDVSPFDNSKTKKQGVSRTYKGHDGYAPIFAYLGLEGYAVNVNLREGKDHCQKGTPEFLAQTIRYAKEITSTPLLLRLDAGNDSADNIRVCRALDTSADFIIKHNLRQEKPETWLLLAQDNGICCEQRPGKCVYRGSIDSPMTGLDRPVRMVFEVTERTIDKHGHLLLVPEIEVDVYLTSLPDPATVIIDLYHAHGTMEQFHSEIKTDLDVERLPSGKFETNDLVLHFAVFAYNLLRIVGQESLKQEDAPLKKQVQRRRIRTVIQNLMTLAAKMTTHARRHYLKLGRHNPWVPTFRRLYATLT